MSSNIMFRYLENYVGKYRVLTELCLDTQDFLRDEKGNILKDYDELYIPCTKGLVKHTYEPFYLMWYTDRLGLGRNVRKEFDNQNIPIHYYEETDSEVLIYFDEKYFEKVAKIIKPKTNGKKIGPFSRRNLKGSKNKVVYTIPENDSKQYASILKDLSQVDKMQFARKVNKNFEDIICKSSNENFDEEYKNSGLGFREFVHFSGLWDDYIKHIKHEYKKLYK